MALTTAGATLALTRGLPAVAAERVAQPCPADTRDPRRCLLQAPEILVGAREVAARMSLDCHIDVRTSEGRVHRRLAAPRWMCRANLRDAPVTVWTWRSKPVAVVLDGRTYRVGTDSPAPLRGVLMGWSGYALALAVVAQLLYRRRYGHGPDLGTKAPWLTNLTFFLPAAMSAYAAVYVSAWWWTAFAACVVGLAAYALWRFPREWPSSER